MENYNIFKAELYAQNVLNKHKKVMVAISGGSDSDIILDMVLKHRRDIDFVFFDTGIEYNATKEHLKYLEGKYGIEIKVVKAHKSIPHCTSHYGVPFLSKIDTEYLSRLQKHNFQWEDGTFDELIIKYPKCKMALKYWCNDNGKGSAFNISRNRHLKEFIMENPPMFKISNMCCTHAKKNPSKKYKHDNCIDLGVSGVRKVEGGVRSTNYKNCFTEGEINEFRPIFYFTDLDKVEYEINNHVEHSKCYTDYGLTRTGCVGCPFNSKFETELEIVRENEPKLFKAVNNIFGASYTYMRMFREYKERING